MEISHSNRQRALIAIVLWALVLRVAFLLLINNPGLNDQNHYYNLGKRLLGGEGFTIDYVWHYSNVPADIVHPIDHWLPLSGVAVAIGMAIGGENSDAALILFVLAGALLPLLVYAVGKQLELSEIGALAGAGFAATLPDIVWNSVRTDTTIFNMVFVTGFCWLLIRGLRQGGWWHFVVAGVLGGLGYLNRNDSTLLLPLLFGVLAVYALFGKSERVPRRLWQAGLLIPISYGLVIAPWLVRNWLVLGMLGSAESSRMFFMVDQRDHYAYNAEITLQTMLAQRTIGELIGKRLFELVAAVKQLIISLDVFLPVFVPLGLLIAFWTPQRRRWLALSPAILWIIGIMIAYPILLPYKSQSGSFEKAYLSIVPMLLPLAGLAITHITQERRYQVSLIVLAMLVMSANSYDVVRRETTFADTYYANIARVVAVIETLPDVNGDGEVRMMSQDPYVMSYYGIRSVMTPLASREDTLELAQRYSIDYMIFPAGRPPLEAIYMGAEQDDRFVFTASVPIPNVRPYEIYELRP